jgi:HAT1-interacting factor 1
MPGESAAERQARIQKAAEGANDISGLVRQRKKPKAAAEAEEQQAVNGNGVNGKRKLEESDDVGSEKKVRFDE